MTDRPILFSAPMVRALLAGRKTQTRRIINPQPKPCDHKPWPGVYEPRWKIDGAEMYCATCGNGVALTRDGKGTRAIPLRFAKGDRLWVKENWLPDPPRDDDAWDDWECSSVEFDGCGLKATMVPPPLRTAEHALHAATWTGTELRWKPSIHMPRWASRLTLTVTDVRVQRLQEISEADAIAEGAGQAYGEPCHSDSALTDRRRFELLWTSINGAGTWDANPWIVTLTFTVERRNIDA